MKAPAISAVPSTPSVSAAKPKIPCLCFNSIARARQNSALGPPTPFPLAVTVNSPPDSKRTGGCVFDKLSWI